MLSPSNIDTEILAELEAAEQDDVAAQDRLASAFMHRLRAGWRLLEKKETIPHDGHWREYLRGLAEQLAGKGYPASGRSYSLRWFQEWMFLAKHLPSEEKAQPVAHLGMKENLTRIRIENKPKIAPLVDDVAGDQLRILVGDCRERLKEFADKSVHCCITSPPYFGLRCYDVEPSIWGCRDPCDHDWDNHGCPGNGGRTRSEKVQIKGKDNFQIVAPSEYAVCGKCGAWRGVLGLEPTPKLYVEHICEVFDEVWRVLRDDGTLWIVIGDSFNSGPPGANPVGFQGAAMRANPAYNSAQSREPIKGGYQNGLKPKDLIGIPWMLAFALRAKGWHLRSEIIWHKRNTTPESVTDRPTKSHETVFLLTKQPTYYYDNEAIKEPGVSIDGPRNCRDVWTIFSSESFGGDHFATFPKALVKPMVMAGTSEAGCCSKCGAPWVRTFERTAMKEYHYQKIGIPGEGEQRGQRVGQCGSTQYAPNGWSPSCSCNAGTVPCTVLDIFGGTGTTALVANALGRKAVLIEANPKYAAMAQHRIDKELRGYLAKANSEDAWGNPISQARERKPILIRKLVEWDEMMVAIYVKKDRPRYVETKPSVAG